MSNTILVQCHHCGKDIHKPLKEYRRRIKNGHNTFFCNGTCATYHNPALVSNFGKHIGKIIGMKRQSDEFSPFRYYVSKSRARKEYGTPDITVEYLKSLWEAQNGICPYTNKKMELPINTQDHHIKGIPTRASLDRIDSNKGYVIGNVEFVCLAVNYAKNGFSKEQMVDFFKT